MGKSGGVAPLVSNMYYIRLFLYDVSLRVFQCHFTQCIGAVTKSIQTGTITVGTVTNALHKVTLTKS